ncbi:hypothetical protein Z969_06940 [Clostridium novyi A str. 4570]|uniref:DUF1284 domain-containing protein n=1 Tax=Clostridium novyi A str. 4570 TaxID=1444290 RepID=A0AA88ZMT9_CLONO|nr:DUF1284 domain-containing protein [Clostridium novyi]KGN02153.1 hypothetical protein Z969_06940 [Clostridium novyi A str. 4570]
MLNLRAHHLFCIQGYLGNGYSEKFTKNMDKIVEKLKANPNITLKVINKVDDVCRCCPNKLENNLCESQEKVNNLDLKVLEFLKIEPNREYVYEELVKYIKENLTYDTFYDICKNCGWFTMGYCKSQLFRE